MFCLISAIVHAMAESIFSTTIGRKGEYGSAGVQAKDL